MNKEEIIKRALIILHTTGYTNELEKSLCIDAIEQLQQENKQLKHNLEIQNKTNEALNKENQELFNKIDKAIEYMQDFIFEGLLVNEDRKLIMYNQNLRKFEEILKGE